MLEFTRNIYIHIYIYIYIYSVWIYGLQPGVGHHLVWNKEWTSTCFKERSRGQRIWISMVLLWPAERTQEWYHPVRGRFQRFSTLLHQEQHMGTLQFKKKHDFSRWTRRYSTCIYIYHEAIQPTTNEDSPSFLKPLLVPGAILSSAINTENLGHVWK